MLVGHYAVAFTAKRIETAVPLGMLVLAAMLGDILWCVFMMAGIERVRFGAGPGAANYFAPENIALSHSLSMDAVWGALLALAYYLSRRHVRGAVVIFAVVLSHWVLDWVSHRPDMPLVPGLHKTFGLGLWTSVPASVLIEGGFWVFALILYARATRARNWAGSYMFWAMAALLTLAWWNNLSGPPPRDPGSAPVASLTFFSLTVAWAFWMDRVRAVRVHAALGGN
jgi:hypothetical protein